MRSVNFSMNKAVYAGGAFALSAAALYYRGNSLESLPYRIRFVCKTFLTNLASSLSNASSSKIKPTNTPEGDENLPAIPVQKRSRFLLRL